MLGGEEQGMRNLLIGGAFALMAAGPAAAGEVELGFHLGWNKSLSSDVSFTGPGGTDFTVADVPWYGLSLPGDDGAPYYGGRATYWFNRGHGWGVMLDYSHAKVRAKPDAVVTLSGDTGASGVAAGDYAVSSLFDTLEFTDGVNLVTLSAMYRFRRVSMIQPYAGVGAGVNIPHVEVTGAALSDLPHTFDYHNGGATFQAMAGADLRIANNVSFYGEYRINYTPVDAPLSDASYKMKTDLFTNQLLFGFALHF